jgi:hypothetical protein
LCVRAGYCEYGNEYLGPIEERTPVLQLNINYSTGLLVKLEVMVNFSRWPLPHNVIIWLHCSLVSHVICDNMLAYKWLVQMAFHIVLHVNQLDIFEQTLTIKCFVCDCIIIITNNGKCGTFRNLFKQLQILTLPTQYIFSLLVFVVKNRDLFLSNSKIHDINTRYNYNLHLPTTNSTLVQKGVLYSGSRIYNHLPLHIKILFNDLKHFKSKLKSFLIEQTLYSLEEFYQVTSK